MDTIDKKLKTSTVAAAEGITTRALYDRIRAGTFPQPDFPSSGNGSPNYWLESTLRKHRDEQLASRLAQHGAPRSVPRRSPLAAS